ncbi:hypothetical protein MKX01_025557 [Papaver californicum]|nr:hypothetical protein MKX01_025557 [Papaver californicum]
MFVYFLHLSNNGLNSLPSTLVDMCTQLSTLDLHNTEITTDVLCQFKGWEAFDERRRLKHQKQLDFRVGSSGVSDEGTDKNLKRYSLKSHNANYWCMNPVLYTLCI